MLMTDANTQTGTSTAARSAPPQIAAVRRTDLMLRAKYPQLETRIFQVGPFGYMICFDQAVLNVSDVASEFASNIRPVTLQITLSNTIPTSFLRELPPIPDHEIAKGFSGFSFQPGGPQDYSCRQAP